jgi:PKD repeat protein
VRLSWGTGKRSGFKRCAAGLATLGTALSLLFAGQAGADWSPSVTVTEGGTQYGFGQDLGPAGDGMVVWSAPTVGGGGYSVFARRVGTAAERGEKLYVSSPTPGAAFTSSYAPAVHYDASGAATVVWLESSYGSESCLAETEPQAGEPPCQVDEYVKARQIDTGGSLGSERVLYHRHAEYPLEGQFGGGDYVTYGQPAIAAGPGGTLTVVWSESSFGSGCAAYGYSSSYADSECEAEESIRWLRLSAAALPQGQPQVAYEGHVSGYGSGQPLLNVRIGAAADGTATVLFSTREDGAGSGCWGGQSSVDYLRIAAAGTLGAVHKLGSGCGSTAPDLAVDPGGTAFAVWGWEGTYSGEEAMLARINPAGQAETPQTLLDSGEGASVAGLYVARGPGSATAVWSAEGAIHARRLPLSGALDPVVDLAAPAPRHYLSYPRVAVAPDGSALVSWEDGPQYGEGNAHAVRAVALAPNGSPAAPHTLLAANHWDHGTKVSAGADASFMVSWRVSVPHHNRIQAARLSPDAAGGNDDFADAEELDADLPAFAAGSNLSATKQPGEPAHAGDPGGASVWYSWTPTESGPVTLSTCAADGLDPVLAVYTGSALGGLSAVASAASGAPVPCADGDAGVRFEAIAGTTYRIAVDGQSGTRGSFGLRLASRADAPSNDSFSAPRQVSGALDYRTGTNVDASKQPGEPDHGGDSGGASVWYSWTASRSAAASVSVCGYELKGPLLGVYTGSAVGSLTPVQGTGAAHAGCGPEGVAVRFNAVAGTTYRIAVDGKGGREGRFQLRFALEPENDDLDQAQALFGFGPYSTLSGVNVAASKQSGEPAHAGNPGGASVWYSWTPTESGSAVVSACLFAGREEGALLGVYTGSDVAHLTEVGSDAPAGSTSGCFSGKSEVSFAFQASTTYWIAVDGEDGAESSFSLGFEVLPNNDDFADARVLGSGIQQSVSGTNRRATKQPGEPAHAGNPGGASVWYSWTPLSSGTAVVSACLSAAGPSSGALLGVYTGSDLAHLTEVGSDAGSGTTSGCSNHYSEVRFDYTGGTTYHFAVDGKNGAEGFFSLSIESPPANDDFAQAQQLQAPQTVFSNNRHAGKQPGEPAHAGNPGGASVWYSWTPTESGAGTVSACAFSGSSPLLGVYTGSDVARLTEVAADVGSGTGSCFGSSSAVDFDVEAGTTYYIALDGQTGAESSFELHLEFEPSPTNDDFASPRQLDQGGSVFASNRQATKQPGEPAHAGNPGGASLWFEWTPGESGTYGIATCSFGSLDALLAVYTGSSLASLEQAAANDDGADSACSAGDSEVRFDAIVGTTYRIAVDGKAGSTGSFELELIPTPVNDQFAGAESLSSELPSSGFGSTRFASKQPGEPAHAGNPGGASVWYSWTPTESGTVEASVCTFSSLDPLLGVYTGSAVGSLTAVPGTRESSGVECSGEGEVIKFTALAGTTYEIAIDGKDGKQGSFDLALRGTPDNDDFADATQIGGFLPRFLFGDNRLATKQPGEPAHAGDPGGASVWFEWTPEASGPVAISACGNGTLDPLLAVYSGADLTDLQPVAADDGPSGECGTAKSEVRFAAVAGTTYRIAVDGKGGSEGGFQLRLGAAPPANDDFADAIEIPQGSAKVAGDNVGATIEPGESGAQTVWYKLAAQETGTVRLHTCSDEGSPMDIKVYTGSSPTALSPVSVLPAGTSGACNSPPGVFYLGDTPVVAFHAVSGTTYRIAVDSYTQISPTYEQRPPGPFTLVEDAPADDLRAAPEGIPAEGGTLDRSNAGATREAGEAEHAGDPGGASIWLRWFAQADGPVSIDTCGSAIDTLLSIEAVGDEEVASNGDSDDCGPGSTASSVAFEAEEGERYLIAVDGKGGQSGQLRLHLAFNTADTTPPETVAYLPVAVNTSSFSASVVPDEPGSHFECALDGGPFLACEFSGGEEFATVTVNGLGEGSHVFAIREVDRAGNADPTPVSGEFTVDKVPPQTEISAGPAGLTRNPGPFTFTASEPGNFECWLDNSTPQYCASPFTAPNTLADGAHVLHVRAVDLAGNPDPTPASRSFDLDRTPPVAHVDGGPSGTIETDTASFEFSANEKASFRCQLDERPVDDCTSPRGYAGLADGDHVFSVTATDLAGNVGKPATRSFHVENRPPQTEIESGPPAHAGSSSAEFEFGADEEASGFECALDEGAFGACSTPDVIGGLADGEHTLRVRAIDTAGKQDPTPAVWTWVVDTHAPQTTIASGPSGLTRHRGPFGFSSDEAVDHYECAVDESQYASCGSGYALPGDLADGEHTLRVGAVDLAGNVDASPAERTLTLDTTGPGEPILTPPPLLTHADFAVEFTLDGESAGAECRIDSLSFHPCASPVELKGLNDGPHTFSVRAVDSLGNPGLPASAGFTVDESPPETEIMPGQRDHFGGGAAAIEFRGSPDASEFECSLDGAIFAQCASPVSYEGLGEGSHELRVRAIDSVGNVDPTPAELEFQVDTTPPQTTITSAPSGPVHAATLPFGYESSEEPQHFECALDEGEWRPCAVVLADHRTGSHLFAVRAVDLAGNVDPTPATAPFTVVDHEPEPALDLSRTGGPAPLTVEAEISGSDPDGDAMHYELQWGDGGLHGGIVPDGGLSHTFTQAGVYLVRVDVDDGFGTAAVTRAITVTAPEPLRADAGDDLTAVAGDPVLLDGGGSRPLEGVVHYQWSLSDGSGGSGARITHTFAQPGNYEAELTISGLAGSDNDVALIHVVPPVGEIATVQTSSGGTPLEGVQVVVVLADGRRVDAVSGNDGIARLRGVPDGSYKVFANKSGYVPGVGDLDVSGGTGSGEVSLQPGSAVGISVQSHRMTLEEIEAAGIDTSDPANLHVYEFSIEGHIGYVGRGGFLGGGCSQTACRHGAIITTSQWSKRANAPILTSFRLPARATFLKEFYDVEATITNLAAPGITLEHGHAAISVPDGMSLAPTAAPQSFAYAVPDIPGGGSTTLHWILRGDHEGEYDIGVSYAASLEPFGETISVSGTTEEPIKVWGASALKLKVDLDDEARDSYPYTAFVKLENVADLPVYNPTVEFLQAGHTGYIEQPRQRRSFGVRELGPGQTLTAGPFIFVPRESGSLDLAQSFVRMVAGDSDLGGTIVTHERDPSFDNTPEFSGRWRNDKDLILEWDPVPGAAGYEVYETPDRQTEFGATPVSPTKQFSPTKVMVEADRGDAPLFAVSSILNGERKMIHPLLDGAVEPLAEYPSIHIEDEGGCGGDTTYARMTLEDPDFPLTGFSYVPNAGSATAVKPLSANVYMERIPVSRPGSGKIAHIAVSATNSNPADGTVHRSADLGVCDYVGLGDSFSSGEGALKGGQGFEDSNGCHRSPNAFAQVIRRSREEMVFFTFKACSGAKTQALFETNEKHHDEGPQADWASGAGLVTLSIGGNDVGFVPVLEHCIAAYVIQAPSRLPLPCKIVEGPAVESKLGQLESTLPGKLEKLHKEMAENGRLILVGYPQIFPATKPFPANLPCQLIHPSDIAWMHDMVTRANLALLKIAVDAGVEFVDPNAGGRFDGRDVCRFGSFFNGVRPQEIVESFHPNEFGQEAIAKAVEARIDAKPTTVRIEQGQTITQSILSEAGNELRAHITWPGSDVELSLESPSGEVIDRTHVPAGVGHDLEATSESYLVPDAEPGEWKVKAKGLEVADGGEPVSVEVSQAGQVPEPPFALFEYAVTEGDAPLKVDFDGSGSFDPSHQSLSYHWDFGDGATGSGIHPSHTFGAPGEYTVKLTVEDSDGETDSFESTPIVVRAPKEERGSSGGGGGSSAPSAPASSPPPSPALPSKALKCRKGFKGKRVRGKVRCVKVKRHKKGRGHSKRPGR